MLYANCTQAWNAGVAPLYEGDAGYRVGLDADRDGIACEWPPAAPPPAGGDPGGGNQGGGNVYYANCSEARAAGAAPLYRGDPGYRSALDRDNDGVACE